MNYLCSLYWLYVFTLVVALMLNAREPRMLVLSLVVAGGVFFPVPWFSEPELFYLACLDVELVVGYAAYLLHTRASFAIPCLAACLAACHVTGWFVGPVDGIGPYRVLVPIFEFCQLFTCCALSTPVSKLLMPRPTK